MEGTLIYAALTEVPLPLIVSWDEERLTLARQYSPLISSVSNTQVENTTPSMSSHTFLIRWGKRSLFSPCVLLCWASEVSNRGRRSCDWSRCWWATASSLWRTDSRPSGPDPRRMGLWPGWGRKTARKKKRTSLISTWDMFHLLRTRTGTSEPEGWRNGRIRILKCLFSWTSVN